MRIRHLGWALCAAFGCGASPAPDNGDPVRIFDETLSVPSSPKVLLVLVVDDREAPEAEALRRGITEATRRLARAYVNVDPASEALWHPVDLRVFVVGASLPSVPPTAPETDAPLALTTVQATREGADALAEAVGGRALALTARADAPFHPLERARALVSLLAQERGAWEIALSLVVGADDASPEPPGAYAFPDDALAPANIGLVTPVSCTGTGVDAQRWPRLAAWSDARSVSPPSCEATSQGAFELLPTWSSGLRLPRCDGRPIRQPSPGLGACDITITTKESACLAARGWADPKDADGVRRARTNADGARVCEALPVDAAFMDVCIHDASCPGCGSGWCVAPAPGAGCPAGQMRPPIRWVGGVLPDPGTVHVVCLEER